MAQTRKCNSVMFLIRLIYGPIRDNKLFKNSYNSKKLFKNSIKVNFMAQNIYCMMRDSMKFYEKTGIFFSEHDSLVPYLTICIWLANEVN